jgi:choline transport protein
MNMSSTDKDPAQAKTMVDEDSQSVAHGTILGDDVDDAVLRANGHSSDLKRQFSWISALGLSFSITNSWAGYLVSCKAV